MKKRIFVIGFIVLLCMNQFINVLHVYAAQIEADQELQSESVDWEDIYTINANDKKWKELETEQIKFEKTQIKPAVIKTMDTETLLEAVISSPMIYTIENFIDRKDGVEAFINKLNTGKELLERSDVKEEIIEEYLSLQIPEKTRNDYSEIHNSKDLDNTLTELLKDKEFSENLDKDIDIYYRVHFLEGILLSDEIYDLLNADEKRKIYHKSLALNEEKKLSEIFSYSAEESFTNTLLDDSELKNAVLLRSSGTTTTVTVYTPKGTAVSATKYSDNHLNSETYVASFKKNNPDKEVVENGYSHNNCHAYSWPRRSDVWMNSASDFISDGSYTKISGARPTANWQRVINSAGSHSAYVVEYSAEKPRIRTKMGGSPVYECNLDVDFSGAGYSIYQC